MSAANTRVVPFAISIEQFLKAVFGARWREALVAYFAGNPKHGVWLVYPAGTVMSALRPNLNLYYDVSLPAGPTRQITDFGALYVIVLDDYGTKVDPARIEFLMGIAPSYVIETSPGNFQAGWFVEPLTDQAWVRGLLTLLYEAMGQTGDNLKKLTTLVRLPAGTNGKPALGPKGFKVRLVRWRPSHRIRQSDWGNVETRIGTVIPRLPLQGTAGAKGMPDPGDIEADAILQVFREQGMVLDNGSRRAFGWAYKVQCPQAAWHSDGTIEAHYVPVWQRFKCHHNGCVDFGREALRRWADSWLMLAGEVCVAGRDFDDVDPALVLPDWTGRVNAGATRDEDPIDLWDQKTPPPWPGSVLPGTIEDTLSKLAERDGLDLAALGATALTTMSGATDKRTLLQPYAGSSWQVRPNLWLLLVAETGQRKSEIFRHLLRQLKRLNLERMQRHAAALAAWRAQPAAVRGVPPTVAALLGEDTTVEKLQEWMSGNPRGLLYLRDEIAALFEFGRYSAGAGGAERAFFLETYDGGPTTIGRMTRTTPIANCALSIIGAIQQQRLADFKGLADDGLLPRFGIVLGNELQRAARTVGAAPPDTHAIDAAINGLLQRGAFDTYRLDAAGEALVRETETMTEALNHMPGASIGFRGFTQKLHGVHARAALVLHLLDGGQDVLVPENTVQRAERYTRFLFGHAAVFYAGLPGSTDAIARAIGGFILRKGPQRVTAGQLRRDVALCKELRTLKDIQDAVFLLVIGGWLQPETNWPSNSAWRVRAGLQDQFAERCRLENDRAERIKQTMNHLGRYR